MRKRMIEAVKQARDLWRRITGDYQRSPGINELLIWLMQERVDAAERAVKQSRVTCTQCSGTGKMMLMMYEAARPVPKTCTRCDGRGVVLTPMGERYAVHKALDVEQWT